MSNSDKEMIKIISYGISKYSVQSATMYVKVLSWKAVTCSYRVPLWWRNDKNDLLWHFKIYDTKCLDANPPLRLILYQVILHSFLSCDMYSMPLLSPRCLYIGFCLFPAWWLHPVFRFLCDRLLNPNYFVHHTKCSGLKELMFLMCYKWVTWIVMFI
jgi:hypothetical protein